MMSSFRRIQILAATPWLMSFVFLAPVVLGLLGTWLPAFGYFPAIGLDQLSLEPWIALVNHPSFTTATINTLVTGIGASLLSIFLLALILIGTYPSKWFNRLERVLSPILSVPHAAFAIGLGFLLTPSGWLVRGLANLSGQFESPPLWVTFQDPVGFSLILALALKELPFLIFMSLAILPTLKAHKTMWLVKTSGHSVRYAWLWFLIPQLYHQLKLPFFAVIAYSLTVVDIALIAGPTTPPTLAVLITQLFNDPDLTQRTVGAAGATLLLLIVIAVLWLTHMLEQPLGRWRRHQLMNGEKREQHRHWEQPLATFSISILIGVYFFSFLVTLLWSFSKHWRYPDIIPTELSLRAWTRVSDRIGEPFWCTLILAILSALIAIVLVIGALENEIRLQQKRANINFNHALWLIYLPLLIPQIAFLFGFQVSLIQMRLDGYFISLLWSHLVFVVPYVFLALSGPYRKYDQRFSWQALSLNGHSLQVFWRVKFQILLRPILYAFATGFSVSIAQYLPTLFIGAGKFSTITTEAVAMASGGNRKMMAVMAVWQQILPFLVFALATFLPAALFRNRRAMKQF